MAGEPHDDFLIEIQSWHRNLSLLPRPPGVPRKHRFQDGLIFTNGLEMQGQVILPRLRHGQAIRIWTSQLQGRRAVARRLVDIGSIEQRSVTSPGAELLASIDLPSATLDAISISLGSVWKYLRLSVEGDMESGARITAFAFVSEPAPENLTP